MSLQQPRGFTIIELLIVIVIIGVLSAIAIPTVEGARVRARNADRISTLASIKTALALYYQHNGYYPPVCGEPVDPGWGFFDAPNCSQENPNLRMDKTDSGDFVSLLYPDFFNRASWTPPLSTDPTYQCRYVIPQTSQTQNNGCPDPSTYKEIQRYYLFCPVEGENIEAQNDGGMSPNLIEIYEPSNWLCRQQKNCGNGVLDAGEECDYNNSDNTCATLHDPSWECMSSCNCWLPPQPDPCHIDPWKCYLIPPNPIPL